MRLDRVKVFWEDGGLSGWLPFSSILYDIERCPPVLQKGLDAFAAVSPENIQIGESVFKGEGI